MLFYGCTPQNMYYVMITFLFTLDFTHGSNKIIMAFYLFKSTET